MALNERKPLDAINRQESEWRHNYGDMDFYQMAAASTGIYPAHRAVDYPIVGLAGEAGELLNKLKKVWRDGTPLDPHDTVKELGDCLWYIALIADDMDIQMSSIAQVNLRKLLDRQERGVIGGSGDNR